MPHLAPGFVVGKQARYEATFAVGAFEVGFWNCAQWSSNQLGAPLLTAGQELIWATQMAATRQGGGLMLLR